VADKVKSIHVERLDEIQKQVHKQCLKPNGFVKKGRTHCRKTTDGLYQVINFQIGQSYRDDTDKFWVNVGIRVPEAFERSLDIVTEKDFYQEYQCDIRTTLFHFTELGDYKGYSNKYFNLEDENVSTIANEIISLINKYVMPMFSDLENRDKVLINRRKYIAVTTPFNNVIDLEFAMIYARRGEMEKANEYINKQYAESQHKGHREYLKELAEKLGLKIK
jgi:hypothetical protein